MTKRGQATHTIMKRADVFGQGRNYFVKSCYLVFIFKLTTYLTRPVFNMWDTFLDIEVIVKILNL